MLKLESVLKKCGQFVTHVDLGQCYDNTIIENFANIISKKCPNLQEVNIGRQLFDDERKIDVLMPIFDKIKRLDCSFIDDDYETNDEDLGKLLSLNQKLEFFSISVNEVLNGTFLDAIRGESMKELRITFARDIPFRTICRVS